jgi:hypothetical protein
MKKTMKKTMVKKATAKKPMMKRGSAKKPLRKAQMGTSVDDEYNRNYAKMRDAEKELKYITSVPPSQYTDEKTWSKVYKKSMARLFEDAPNYLGVRVPYATDADMKAYDKEVAAFYKANPNVSPYVGSLPTKRPTPIQKKGGATKAAYKKGEVTKSTVKKVTVKTKRKK